eukprot:2521370-Prymnesium_polylepis.1
MLRWTIVRSSKRAVASIEAAQQATIASYAVASNASSTAAGGGGTMVLEEVAVYYHLHTQARHAHIRR